MQGDPFFPLHFLIKFSTFELSLRIITVQYFHSQKFGIMDNHRHVLAMLPHHLRGSIQDQLHNRRAISAAILEVSVTCLFVFRHLVLYMCWRKQASTHQVELQWHLRAAFPLSVNPTLPWRVVCHS